MMDFLHRMAAFMMLEAILLDLAMSLFTNNPAIITFVHTSPWMLLYYGFFGAIYATGTRPREARP